MTTTTDFNHKRNEWKYLKVLLVNKWWRILALSWLCCGKLGVNLPFLGNWMDGLFIWPSYFCLTTTAEVIFQEMPELFRAGFLLSRNCLNRTWNHLPYSFRLKLIVLETETSIHSFVAVWSQGSTYLVQETSTRKIKVLKVWRCFGVNNDLNLFHTTRWCAVIHFFLKSVQESSTWYKRGPDSINVNIQIP